MDHRSLIIEMEYVMPTLMSPRSTKEQIHQFCSFRIAGYLYGINIKDVKEINQEFRITPVPHAPSYISGLINIRGEIYLIFDLRVWFGFPPSTVEKTDRLILCKNASIEFSGIRVDTLEDVIRVPAHQIETYNSEDLTKSMSFLKHSEHLEGGAHLVQGVHQLKSEIMIILNIRALNDIDTG